MKRFIKSQPSADDLVVATSGSERAAAQEQLARDLLTGRACLECGEPTFPPEPCEACAEKRELLRQVFPELHGDA